MLTQGHIILKSRLGYNEGNVILKSRLAYNAGTHHFREYSDQNRWDKSLG